MICGRLNAEHYAYVLCRNTHPSPLHALDRHTKTARVVYHSSSWPHRVLAALRCYRSFTTYRALRKTTIFNPLKLHRQQDSSNIILRRINSPICILHLDLTWFTDTITFKIENLLIRNSHWSDEPYDPTHLNILYCRLDLMTVMVHHLTNDTLYQPQTGCTWKRCHLALSCWTNSTGLHAHICTAKKINAVRKTN